MTKKQMLEEDLRMSISHNKDLLSYYKNLTKHYEEHLADTVVLVKKTEKALSSAENTYKEFIQANTTERK